MNMKHPYIKYAQALLIEENNLESIEDITHNHIKQELAKGLDTFSLKPIKDFVGKEKVKYSFVSEKNDAKHFIYLSPNIISTEMKASNIYKFLRKDIDEDLQKSCKVSQSAMPIVGEYCTFSNKGIVGRGKPTSTIYEECLAAITTATTLKPCLQSGKENVCIIPDLEVENLTDFIKLFKRISLVNSESDLMEGVVVKTSKREKGKDIYIPKRPKIFRGNFPNAPRSPALCSVALLGTIGEMVKNSDTSLLAKRVIKCLENTDIYIVSYGNASVFTYNHYIIQLASKGSLRKIVDSIYWCNLYKYVDREKYNPNEDVEKTKDYEVFDLFAGRFLQLFNRPAFKDFLSFRAEYPADLKLLLMTYFENMEKIDAKVVVSAKELGSWLNGVAYRAAKKMLREEGKSSDEELRKTKAKFLVELESSAFAAKSGDALVAQVITRAGRLSGSDAPSEASLFMEQAISGELELSKAKNLLISFSRLRKEKEQDIQRIVEDTEQNNESIENDYSNI